MERLTKEEVIAKMFDEISEKLTPEFSGEDWLKLFNRANQGDLTSAEMLMELWKKKVNPHLHPDWQIKTEKN